ncbi:M48 family metallopeptidase [Agrilutibacter solisilvae]|uniref:M48 family metalloprotease n=1 Tax=Agrilutibacter solisilvae TaxID=2763317 RepID=A0A974XXR4_9GAMM|nr:M48 family metallopeptidase [Lysobacter solisilvae]QSX77732.1 M48 family metalloprotease [Lysobacter solisilvae]
MESIYPAGPSAVPERLTEPSASYRRHAWLAMTGLMAFIAGYFGLLAWFASTAWRMFQGLATQGADDNVLFRIVGGLCAAFLAIFMLKALVFVQRRKASSDDLELTPGEQPELFAFLHRLADDAGAPRPHRVYLSPRVNAAVFYDLSVVNLILPSRKNLEIGLGLMNVLNLGEFKAVLAHEFGHFAQRTMAVGRWVYIAQQVAAHIISRRDALDTLLQTLSRVDFRVAWIGWLLQIVVWSIRSLVELLFRVVVLAQRALSREMEYQADLVAASLTGSDALVHSLHRLGGADDAWDRAVGFAAAEAGAQRPVKDVFAIQTRVLDHLRVIFADASLGQSPAPAGAQPEQHRVFGKELARPPQMWSTHPANADREENVKRRYIAASIDTRPALVLLRDADALKARISRQLFTGELPPAVAIEDSLARLDEEFSRRSLHQRYRGTYLGRMPFREHEHLDEVYAAPGVVTDLHSQIAALYPAEHGDRLEQLRELEQARSTLQAVQDGYLTPSGGVVHWRGADVSRREVPRVLEQIKRDAAALKQQVLEHDRQCRHLHVLAAGRLGGEWEAYLRSLAAVLHYAEHSEANLRDAHGLLINTYTVVTADRNVSSNELRRLVNAANEVHRALSPLYRNSPQLTLDERTATRLGTTWSDALGAFSLSAPNQDNIGQWLGVVDGWVNATTSALSALRRAALETLLEAEDEVAAAVSHSASVGPAPAALKVPTEFPRLRPGMERKLQNRLGWWDRFQTAEGVGPTLARVVAAGGVVGAVVFAGSAFGKSELVIFNGLDVPVQIAVDGSTIDVAAQQHASLSLDGDGDHDVRTATVDGAVVETFTATTDGAAHYVYNVASAASLVEWTASYGSAGGRSERMLGVPRWSQTDAEYLFVDPPQQIQTGRNGGTRSVLSALADPNAVMSTVNAPEEQARVAQAHLRWDPSDSRSLALWMWRAQPLPGFDALLAQRLERHPGEVLTLRMQQDASKGAAHERVCADQRAMAERNADNADLQYLAIRCMPDGAQQDAAFLAAHTRWPDNGWLQLAAGYVAAERQQWDQASTLWTGATQRLPAAGEWIGLDLARVRRMAQGSDTAVADLAQVSSMLRQMLLLEAGTGEDTPYAAYASLAKGDLVTGLKQSADSEVEEDVVHLVAASDGAPDDVVARSVRTPPGQDASESVAFLALAVAAREGADTSALRARLAASEDEDAGAVLRFFDQVRSGGGEQAAEQALGDVSPRARGTAYAMAAVLRGQRCPAQWREAARRLLFVMERPYLG